MKLSARNQLKGKVTNVQEGAVNSIVTIDVNGSSVTATISKAAVKELELAKGVDAVAVIKATEVMIGKGIFKLSARNQFPGKVLSVEEGAVNSIVKIDSSVGQITATISNAAVNDLGLAKGVDATAVIKATSVMVGR